MIVKHENALSSVKELLFPQFREKASYSSSYPTLLADRKVIFGVGSMLTMPAVAMKHATIQAIAMQKLLANAPETMTLQYARMIFSPETKMKAHVFSWEALNFMTVSAVTCSIIVAVQSPAKTMLVSLAKDGKLIPTYAGGLLALGRVMYTGTTSALSGSALRTAYVNGAKEVKPVEETRTKQAGYVVGIAIGELAVKQIPESISHLQKAKMITPKFNWKTLNNSYHLMTGAFTPKLVSGFINMGCLCLLSDTVAENLPLANKELAYGVAGGTSGVIAAFVSYPFAAFGDHVLIQGTVSDEGNGKLTSVNSFTVLKKLVTQASENPKEALKSFAKNSRTPLFIRVGVTATIFTIVSVVGEVLGKEPLKAVAPGLRPASKMGFFNAAPAADATALEHKDPSVVLKA